MVKESCNGQERTVISSLAATCTHAFFVFASGDIFFIIQVH